MKERQKVTLSSVCHLINGFENVWSLTRYYYLVKWNISVNALIVFPPGRVTLLDFLCLKGPMCWMQRGRESGEGRLSRSAQGESYKPLSRTTANRYKAARGESSRASAVYQLAERRAAPDRWHFRSIIPQGWKDPAHDGKPVQPEETGILNNSLRCWMKDLSMWNMKLQRFTHLQLFWDLSKNAKHSLFYSKWLDFYISLSCMISNCWIIVMAYWYFSSFNHLTEKTIIIWGLINDENNTCSHMDTCVYYFYRQKQTEF